MTSWNMVLSNLTHLLLHEFSLVFSPFELDFFYKIGSSILRT